MSLRILALSLLLVGSCGLTVSSIHGRSEVSLIPKKQQAVKEATPQEEVRVPHGYSTFPVPTTAKCIVIICIQYMVIYTALALCRTYHEFSGTAKGNVEAGLAVAAQTLTYGPMLCVLFIACRMRVEFLSNGEGQPQIWVQNCMYAVTWAVMASTLLVLFIPLVTGRSVPLSKDSCDLERCPSSRLPQASVDESRVTVITLTIIRYLILLGLYGGLAGIIVGINVYVPPGETDVSKLPVPAPAVMCTMILAVVFFATQLIIAGCRTYKELSGVDFPTIVAVMQAAATTVEFAPMLAILFLSARMRALQHDGQPQVWAQNCMFMATGAMCVTALLAVFVPVVMGGHMEISPRTRETTFVVPNPSLGYIFVALRFVCMLGFYGGAMGVIYSIFVFKAPSGPTYPVSPTVHCVINLTCQFFFVYLMMTVMLTVSELSGGRINLEAYRICSAVEAAKATLAFAPMLSILFVTTRMYALLITDKKGAPQAWVQDGMYMATWSVLVSFLSCLVVGLFMDVETDSDGNIVNKFSNTCVAGAMTALRYSTMLLLYGGIVTVIYGLFVMTPETANGRGSLPIVSDAVNATPFGQPPPGPNEISKIGKA